MLFSSEIYVRHECLDRKNCMSSRINVIQCMRRACWFCKQKNFYHECPFSSTNMQSFHQKRAKILLVKKASKLTNPQNYPYSVQEYKLHTTLMSKIKISQLNLLILRDTYQLVVFGLMSSMMAWMTSRVVAWPPRSGVWTCQKYKSTMALNLKETVLCQIYMV